LRNHGSDHAAAALRAWGNDLWRGRVLCGVSLRRREHSVQAPSV